MPPDSRADANLHDFNTNRVILRLLAASYDPAMPTTDNEFAAH
jgi:hypothetical protein